MEPRADDVKHWSDCCAGLLRETWDVLREIDDSLFSSPHLTVQASIGTHLRHLIGAVECLLAGTDDAEIDYDRRSRNQRLERHREAAMDCLERLAMRIQTELADRADSSVRIWCDEPKAPRGPGAASSLVRELRYVASHTVHHQAMIATILRTHDIPVPEGFGIARSTLVHLEREGS